MIREYLESIGSFAIHFIESVGRLVLFLISGVVNIFSPPFKFHRIIEHIWFIGAKSMLVIILTGLFTGMVLGLQGYYTFTQFGSEGALGSVVALSLIFSLLRFICLIFFKKRLNIGAQKGFAKVV